MTGVLGLVVYTLIGASATVVMQSSHATMTLIITALAAVAEEEMVTEEDGVGFKRHPVVHT